MILPMREFDLGPMTIAEPIVARTISPAGEASARARRLILFVPLIGFLGLVIALAWGMSRNPTAIPSALIGKPVPQFSLPPVKGRTLGLSSADLHGEVSLVNVFASWCVACREEHPVLMQMKADNIVPIHGLNYKDQPDNAARWLNTMGDPYTRWPRGDRLGCLRCTRDLRGHQEWPHCVQTNRRSNAEGS